MTTTAIRATLFLVVVILIAPSTVWAQNKPLANNRVTAEQSAPAAVMAKAPMNSAPSIGKDMIAIYGHGNSKCSDFIDYSMRGPDVIVKNYQVWVNGFLSAYNTLISASGNVTKGKKSEELMGWVQNYCRQNPTSYFQRATIELLRALESGEF